MPSSGLERLQPGTISADGRTVFFSTGGAGAKPIYARANGGQPESARTLGAATGTATVIGPAAGVANVFKSKGGEIEGLAPCNGFAPHQQVSDTGGAIPAATTIVSLEETAEGVCSVLLSAVPSANKLNDTLIGEASATLYDLSAESGAFEAGQTIEGPGIPLGTKLESCAPECGAAASSLTLSAKATKTTIGARIGAFSPCAEAASKACTTPVSEAAEVSEGASGATFWGAAADGSRAVFSVGNLEFSKATLHAFAVGAEADTEIAGRVRGVLGMSADASRVYFASAEALGGRQQRGR